MHSELVTTPKRLYYLPESVYLLSDHWSPTIFLWDIEFLVENLAGLFESRYFFARYNDPFHVESLVVARVDTPSPHRRW